MLEAEIDDHLGMHLMKVQIAQTRETERRVRHSAVHMEKWILMLHKTEKAPLKPKVVQKRQKDISGIEKKIIAMCAKGLTTSQISDQIQDIYVFEVSESMVSVITNKLLPEIETWQQRSLFRI